MQKQIRSVTTLQDYAFSALYCKPILTVCRPGGLDLWNFLTIAQTRLMTRAQAVTSTMLIIVTSIRNQDTLLFPKVLLCFSWVSRRLLQTDRVLRMHPIIYRPPERETISMAPGADAIYWRHMSMDNWVKMYAVRENCFDDAIFIQNNVYALLTIGGARLDHLDWHVTMHDGIIKKYAFI